MSNPHEWPSVIIDSDDDFHLDKLIESLTMSGFELAESTYNPHEKPGSQFSLFGMVQVRIPPELIAIERTTEMTGVRAVYDPEYTYSLPQPVLDTDDLRTELDRSVSIIWPDNAL